jgi:hypothetical protein
VGAIHGGLYIFPDWISQYRDRRTADRACRSSTELLCRSPRGHDFHFGAKFPLVVSTPKTSTVTSLLLGSLLPSIGWWSRSSWRGCQA